MSVFTESGYKFDFTAARFSTIHDKLSGDGNTIWSGVDFRVGTNQAELWIEVKSWSWNSISGRYQRQKAKRDFEAKAASKEFAKKITEKFLGTTSYLYWASLPLPNHVAYVVVLEPPTTQQLALLGPLRDNIKRYLKITGQSQFGSRITFELLDIRGFNQRYPTIQVSRVS